MALKINKVKAGKTATYWRIVQLYYNVDEKHLIAVLRGYGNKQKSDEAKDGTDTKSFEHQFTLSGPDFPDVTKANWQNEVYKHIRKQNIYDVDWSKSTEEDDANPSNGNGKSKK